MTDHDTLLSNALLSPDVVDHEASHVTDKEDAPDGSSDNETEESDDELSSFLDSQTRAHKTLSYLWSEDSTIEDTAPPPAKRTRGSEGVVCCADENGIRHVLPPTMSLWHNLHVASPDLSNKRFHEKFRRRFRTPYQQCKELAMAVNNPLFKRWFPGNEDAVGRPAAPIELLLLCSLRHMGRGWTFDDPSESTAISEEVIRVFFRKFIEFGSTVLYDRWVISPSTVEDTEKQSHQFQMAGFPGACGSMDATHVLCEKVKFRLRQAHLGFKINATARSYNLISNHRRRILSTTEGHPARWNDKTIVRFHDFVMGLHKGEKLSDFIFGLYDYDSQGQVIKVKYRGPWLLVDNGYHNWAVTVPPFKSSTSRKEIRFSEWLESMRKDVECTFGILKGRWRILKAGIRVQGLEEVDQIWKTCCSLHNWLLEEDGLDEKWETGVPSEWEGSNGQHDDEVFVSFRDEVPNHKHARNKFLRTFSRGPGFVLGAR